MIDARGLTKRGAFYEYSVTVNGHRYRRSTRTRDIEKAAAIRDAVRERLLNALIDSEEAWSEHVDRLASDPNSWISRMYDRIKRRHRKKKGKSFCAMTRQDLLVLAKASCGRCAITGIPFEDSGPFGPSIDRIDSLRLYEPDNVRLVCAAVNYAMGVWGEEVIVRIGKAFLLKQLKAEIAGTLEN